MSNLDAERLALEQALQSLRSAVDALPIARRTPAEFAPAAIRPVLAETLGGTEPSAVQQTITIEVAASESTPSAFAAFLSRFRWR